MAKFASLSDLDARACYGVIRERLRTHGARTVEAWYRESSDPPLPQAGDRVMELIAALPEAGTVSVPDINFVFGSILSQQLEDFSNQEVEGHRLKKYAQRGLEAQFGHHHHCPERTESTESSSLHARFPYP